MSAGPFFKQAAADLRKAIAEKRHDIGVLERQFQEQEKRYRRQIDEINRGKLEKERHSGETDMDNLMRAELQRQAQEDITHISDIERAISAQRDQIQRQVNAIQQEISHIEQQARDLESKGSL